MSTLRVLVVDDSAFFRSIVTDMIQSNSQFTVVGIARNGRDAIEKTKKFQPDIVTMDVEMPEMDGLTALKQIMKECPTPVAMLSNLTADGAEVTLQALEHGAIDFFSKEELTRNAGDPAVREDFLTRLKSAANAKVKESHVGCVPTKQPMPSVKVKSPPARASTAVELVLIGCSTGGPAALQKVLPNLSATLGAPVVVIQHMPPGFTGPMAQRLNSICQLRVKEAVDGELLTSGTIYVGPAGLQTTFIRDGSDVRIKLTTETSVETKFKPSVDVSLLSASPIFKSNLLSCVLTGMGKDGLIGAKLAKQNGGRVLVESEETCVVYGMPRAIYEAGFADMKIHLAQMADEISHACLN